MTYFNDDFSNLFNELNKSFFNDDNGNTCYYFPTNPTNPQAVQQIEKPKQNDNKVGRDLAKEAKNKKFDPVIGRDDQINAVIEILSRGKKNNPVLIEPTGVSKASIVEGLAQRIASGDVPDELYKMHVYELSINDMVAGSSSHGSFEEKIKEVIDITQKEPSTILFIDELHNTVGTGSTDSENNSRDAANILKPALTSGDLKLVGTTTTSEYRQIEKDLALARRFQAVDVPEPSSEVTIKTLQGLKKKYEEFHHVKYSDDSLGLAVELSQRYIQGRYLPDKAIDLMDEAGAKKGLGIDSADEDSLKQRIHDYQLIKDEAAKAEDYNKASEYKDKISKLKEQFKHIDKVDEPEVTAKDTYALIEQKTKIPVSELYADEAKKNLDLAKKLKSVVIDQDKAIDIITDAIIRKQVFKDTNRPIDSFLLTGPTGVGKIELVKQLAKELFSGSDRLTRLGASEYQDQMVASKLIDSAPGYVGHGEGGQLTRKVRHEPYSLILLDEIERVNPQVFNALLQILGDGRLTDAQGRTVLFKDTIIIMTSDAGFSDRVLKDGEVGKGALMKALELYFRPEFLNRLDAIVPFNHLSSKDMTKIRGLYLQKMENTLSKCKIKMTISDEAKKVLVKRGYDKKFGARPLRRVMEQDLQAPTAKLIMTEPDLQAVDFTADEKHLYLNGKPIVDLVA